MKKVIMGVVLAVFTVCLSMVYVSTFAGAKRMATLTNVKGTVKVKSAGAAEWAAATEKMAIKEGDEIKTAGGSSAIIKMDDGSMIKIGPLAKMNLSSFGKSGKHNKTTLDVAVGKSWNRVNKLSADSSFKIKTPTAVAGVRGTFFSEDVDTSTDATFDVYDGGIDVASADNPDAAVPVNGGQRTEVDANGNVSEPTAIPASELAAGADGFSSSEAAQATYDLQISVSPQVVEPGKVAVVSLQVYKNSQPMAQEVIVTLTLSGNAVFATSGEKTMELTTNDQGTASVEVTSPDKEAVTISAEMRIKVQQ